MWDGKRNFHMTLLEKVALIPGPMVTVSAMLAIGSVLVTHLLALKAQLQEVADTLQHLAHP